MKKNANVLEKTIESKLLDALGFETATFLRTDAELADIADYQPFRKPDLEAAAAFNVAFLKAPPDKSAERKLLSLKTDIDDFRVHGREVYWLCRKKQSESTFSNAVLEKTLGIKSTLRGMNTIHKIAGKYHPSDK